MQPKLMHDLSGFKSVLLVCATPDLTRRGPKVFVKASFDFIVFSIGSDCFYDLFPPFIIGIFNYIITTT